MNLQDAVYNWLSIKQVSDARPEDEAAKDTYNFFVEILKEDHGVEKEEIIKDNVWYTVHVWINEEKKKFQYPVELIDALLRSIETEPKYNQ
jgi:hypothetical protein